MGTDALRPWLEIVALAASPLIAVQVSAWLQRRSEKRNRKEWILATLLATRHSIFADDRLRALNSVELYFHGDSEVRRLFQDYLTLLANEGMNNAEGFVTRDRKLFELVSEIAKELGYGRTFSALDYQRGYVPKFIAQALEQNQKQQQLTDAMLSFFSKAQAIIPNFKLK